MQEKMIKVQRQGINAALSCILQMILLQNFDGSHIEWSILADQTKNIINFKFMVLSIKLAALHCFKVQTSVDFFALAYVYYGL